MTPENMNSFNKLMVIATGRENSETTQRQNKVVLNSNCQKQRQSKRRQGTDDHYQELQGQQRQTSLVLGKRRREDDQNTMDNNRNRQGAHQRNMKDQSFNDKIIYTTSKNKDKSEKDNSTDKECGWTQ